MSAELNSSQSAALAGLSEREVTEIFQLGERHSLKSDEKLTLSDGDGNRRIVLVMKGRVRLLIPKDGEPPDFLELRPGEWGGALSQVSFPHRPQGLSALEPSVVVSLAEKAVQTLDPRLQLAIHDKLADTAVRSAVAFAGGTQRLDARLDMLSLYLRRTTEQKWRSCMESGLIREILEQFPQLPMHASDLAVRLREGHASVRESSQIARQDPALLGAILKAVNSQHPRLRGKVNDLQQATTLLGINQVHRIILDHGVRQTMPDRPEFHQLRDRALLISLICHELGQLQASVPAGALSSLGLLHNVGQSILLLLMRRSPEFKVLIEQLDQARLGALLLRQWNLPESIWRTVHFQDFPFIAPSPTIHSACRREVAFLFVARLCHQHLAGEKEQVYIGPFFDDYQDLTGIPFASLAELAEEKVLPALVGADYDLPESARQFLQDAVRRMRKRFEVG